MSKYHIDVEVVVTKRIYLSDDCDLEAIKAKLQDGDYDITEEEGFIECEYLGETEMLHESTFEGQYPSQSTTPCYISLQLNDAPFFTPWPL